MAKILLSLKLYRELQNHVSELSKKLNREVTVNEMASVALQVGLKQKNLTKKIFKKLGIEQKRRRVDYAEWLWKQLDILSFYTGKSKKEIATEALLCYLENEFQIFTYDAKRGNLELDFELSASDVETFKKWSEILTELLYDYQF